MTEPVDGKWMRDAWRGQAEDAAAAPPVDNESIWRAVAGEGVAEERHRVIDMVAHDPATAESWRLAQELQRELTEREPNWQASPLGDRPAVTPLWRRQWAAMAAMLLLALGLLLWRFVGLAPSSADQPVYRDAPAPELRSQVPEDVAQPRDNVTLSWSDDGPGAPYAGTRYTVRVLKSDFEVLVVLRELTNSSVKLPAQSLDDVTAGERLLWQVEAHRADGQLVTSPTFFLFLAPATEGSTFSEQPPN